MTAKRIDDTAAFVLVDAINRRIYVVVDVAQGNA